MMGVPLIFMRFYIAKNDGPCNLKGLEPHPTLVVLMDALLVFGAPPGVPPVACAATLVYLVVRSAEDEGRFGLYDAVSYAERYRPFLCPPKGTQQIFNTALVRCAVLAVDFAITRSFASGMRNRETALQSSIRAAEEVSEHLAAYFKSCESGRGVKPVL